MQRNRPWNMDRRSFLKGAAAAAAGAVLWPGCARRKGGELVEVTEGAPTGSQVLQSQCPYCGVGCGTLIQVEDGQIVGMVPDKEHPVNRGLQCIKGLTANEPTYVDRLTQCLVRKDMTDPLAGHVSATKGRFDEEVWREASYDEASEIVAEKIAGIVQQFGGNTVGLYGSGQLTLEGQYLENVLMKGVIGSNTMEANARMCMTSAVTAYFKTFGSDTPPTCYDDIELADFITDWGHNPREAHPILFWRIADHKKKHNIPTLVVDPRRTGTVIGYENINPDNSYHASVINGDISFLNAIAHVLLTEREEVIDYEFMKAHTTGWQEYIEGVKARYSPEQVIDRTGLDPAFVRKMAHLWADAALKGKKRGTGGVLSLWGIGYNQHIHGQHNVISIINLHLLTGQMGRPGCGPFSITGQPNAMGERFTGGLTGRLPFNVGLDDAAHRAHIAKSWRIPQERLDTVAESQNSGYAIGMMERALKGDMKAMFLIYATHIDLPETETLVRPALTRMFTVVQDIYRHAPNLLYADVVFPAATWGEWAGGTYINSERRLYVTQGTQNPPAMTLNGEPMKDKDGKVMLCKPDLDIVIDKGIEIAEKLGLNGPEIFPYRKNERGFYDPEEVLRDLLRASEGTDGDLTGILEVEEETGQSPYQQIAELRGIQWPAPTAAIARQGGTPRRYLGQEKGWSDKPYGDFRTESGQANFKLCEQDYSQRDRILAELARCGVEEDFYLIDHPDVLAAARDYALTPELPDFEYAHLPIGQVPAGKYPFWLGLGVVYEHFHTAKTVRGVTTQKLVPEQYVEMHPEDARTLGIQDGEWVRLVTRRGSYEARVSIGTESKVKPARNTVPRGYLFSPWNLSVADDADPQKNKWLVNATSHRAWDVVSGQVDYKKLAARVEKIA